MRSILWRRWSLTALVRLACSIPQDREATSWADISRSASEAASDRRDGSRFHSLPPLRPRLRPRLFLPVGGSKIWRLKIRPQTRFVFDSFLSWPNPSVTRLVASPETISGTSCDGSRLPGRKPVSFSRCMGFLQLVSFLDDQRASATFVPL